MNMAMPLPSSKKLTALRQSIPKIIRSGNSAPTWWHHDTVNFLAAESCFNHFQNLAHRAAQRTSANEWEFPAPGIIPKHRKAIK
jgi:hypothetical protein